ncbi:hypothetical protein [Faecalibacter rhinopitheci]|uniref:GNAT family N-acetyltransferase n=1 Tax=Faecalibacter rhinopitheci TaxID=2779678 RepID=A0A8J7FPH8_9FLAO|nr:hypothetical protein [Faecalibacter rhinopitheci]MBF0596999.1 hypothetical protein [Faecalibacter rhinopitheci]
MIKKIKRSALDLDKYSACLQRAINYRVYAEYWYLDTLTDSQWDCLVLNDYEAIMPLPYQKKLGIKFISQPTYCQQLGVFYANSFPQEIVQLFYKEINHQLVRYYTFNEENTQYLAPNLPQKVNQILNLNVEYNQYKKSLRKNRKQELNKGLQGAQIIYSETAQDFIALLKTEYPAIQKQLALDKLHPLVQIIQQKKLGITINIIENQQVVASSFYIKSGNRLIQLCNAKKNNSIFNYNTFIVDHMIQKFNQQGFILDFEGSSIKGIQDFNASFRAEKKTFVHCKSPLF